MKTVLVTGGLGFIGSHFIDLILEKGYKVINYDKITYASNLDYNPNSQNYSFKKIDIKDLKELPICDYIVHFAAESSVDCSIQDSTPFIDSNILSTYNLLELLKVEKKKGNKIPTLIYIGTDEVFGDILNGSFEETMSLNPSNPYAATKACAEMLIRAWGRTFDIPYRITRTTNNYGERQHIEKLVPRCINNYLCGLKIPIHGDGSYVRNWIYVKDNCSAILKVLESGKNGNVYHISSNEEFSVVEIVNFILNEFGESITPETTEFITNRPGQDIRYSLNNSLIISELNWKQEYTFKDILPKIIDFYRKLNENSTVL